MTVTMDKIFKSAETIRLYPGTLHSKSLFSLLNGNPELLSLI